MDIDAIYAALQQANTQAGEESAWSPVSSFAKSFGDILSQAAQKQAQSGGLGSDDYIGLALGGLSSGFAQNFADNKVKDYQAEQSALAQKVLLDAANGSSVLQPEGMSPSVFSSVRNAGSIFALGKKLEDSEETRKLVKQLGYQKALSDATSDADLERAVAAEIAKNPEAADSIIAGLARLKGKEPPASTSPMVQQPEQQPDTLGVGPTLRERMNGAISEARRKGMTGNAALEYAQTLMKPDLVANQQAEKQLQAARDRVNALDRVINSAESGIKGAGKTGGLGAGVRDLASKTAQFFGSDEQTAKQTAQAELDSTTPDIISITRTPGVGAMSDREMAEYIKAGPSSRNTPEANTVLLGKLKAASQLEKEWLNFTEAFQSQYGTTKGSNRIWQQYKAANPPFVRAQNGEYVPNLNRPTIEQWLGGDQSAPLSGGAVNMPQGNAIGATPQAIPQAAQGLDATASAVPEGAQPTGRTSGGKPVYRLPDGKLWVE